MADQRRAARFTGCVLAVMVFSALITPTTARAVDLAQSTETTEPETSEPDSTGAGTTEPGVVDEDNQNNAPVAIIAVVTFALLIGLACWWMVRRNDDDDAPHPPRQNPDDPPPGQDLF